MTKRFWDPDDAINSDLFNALQASLYKPAPLAALGTLVSDAAPIVSRMTSIVDAQIGVNVGVILPDAQGLFVVTTDDQVTTASVYPSPGTHFAGLNPGDAISIGGGVPYSIMFIRASADLWAVIGSGV